MKAHQAAIRRAVGGELLQTQHHVRGPPLPGASLQGQEQNSTPGLRFCANQAGRGLRSSLAPPLTSSENSGH